MKLFLLTIIQFNCLFATSITGTSNYTKICYQAATDDNVFKEFKRNSEYQVALEHVTYELGLEYLKILELEYPFALSRMTNCQENDLYGNPKTYSYGNFGNLSPTTLRYMKVGADLMHLFGDLKGKTIVEIGGGYGGQCKVLHELSGFKDYVLIDLPEVSLLQKKYLDLLNIKNVKYINNKSFRSKEFSADLLISNYAFTEISRDEQLVYIRNVINKSKSGYITCNFTSDIYGIKSLSLGEITELLKRPG